MRHAIATGALELTNDDVLARVCDLLDRNLFEASVAQDVTTIVTDVHGFEETVAAVLESMEKIVDCDLVSVLLLGPDGQAPDATYVSVAREVTDQHYLDSWRPSPPRPSRRRAGPPRWLTSRRCSLTPMGGSGRKT